MSQDNIRDFFGKRTILAAFELTEALNKVQFKGAETGINTRVLNYWETEGLIPNRRDDDAKWRRYSFVDFVWIKMVDQMRQVGLNFDLIRKVREMVITPTELIDLFTLMMGIGPWMDHAMGEAGEEEFQGYVQAWEKVFADEQIMVTVLQLLIANAIAKRCPIRIVVFLDGEILWIEEHPEFAIHPDFLDRMSYEPFVSFSVSGIIKEYLGSELAFERMDNLQLLDENETFLLQTILSGEYDSITIKYKNEELDSMEMKKSQDVKKKVVDVLAEADYQNITMVQHKGRVTKIENTIKHQFERKSNSEE